MKVLVFATLFVSLIALSLAKSNERDEYFFGENADAAVAFEERDTNTTGVVIPVNNGTISYNVTTGSGEGELKITIPFIIDGAYATLEEATPDNADYQDPTVGTLPGTFLGTTFFLTITKDGNEIHEMFPAPIQISLYDPDFDANSDLYLYDTTTMDWVAASSTCPTSSQLKTFVDGTLTVNVCHLTQFATFSVVPDVTTSGSSSVVAKSSGKDNTTLIVAIVVPIGAVILIAAGVIAYAILHRRKKKSFYDVEMANHKPSVVVTPGSKSPQESRLNELTRGSVNKPDLGTSSDDSEESESELDERKQASESEESSSEEESSQASEESSQDSDDSDTTQETNSDDSDSE